MMSSVIFQVTNHVGIIQLNRPNVINSLNVEMVQFIYEKLREWKNDPDIALVCISGEGAKGLCAGGDMKLLYELRHSHIKDVAYDFFLTEYQMDIMIHLYPKPILVYMDGIVMGGGVGLSVGASYRIVTETTKWSMPEMHIGFYPDVGASYFLNQMPGYTGRYLALTSQLIKAKDVLYCQAADYYLDGNNWNILMDVIYRENWLESNISAKLDLLIKEYSQHVDTSSSMLAANQKNINIHFSYNTIEEIVTSLDHEANNGNDWAKETVNILRSKSPSSLKVTLRQLQKGEGLSLLDCFKMEFALSMNFMDHADFFEGVRSVLVDKDKSPKWLHSRIEDVSDNDILSFFEWNNESMAYKELHELYLKLSS